jgi:phage tail sheath protein FI
VYGNGFDIAATGYFKGFDYIASNIATEGGYTGGATVAGEFTSEEGGGLLVAAADDVKYTVEFLNLTSLGANDAARRLSITTAVTAAINSNTEIRSESFDYNLILAPAYHEVVDELLTLVTDIEDEALIIADTPMNMNPDQITNPSTGWSNTTSRQRSPHVAYYYPSALASNLDGVNVTVAASGVACRTYAYSDSVSYLWFAPAGTRRGGITGISSLGYVSGDLGGVTTFVEVNLNQGQQDALYGTNSSGDINPLIFKPGQGFCVWGQKTSAPQASAMDRVNVSRLIKMIKRDLRRNTLSYVFQPNDQLTRDDLKATVDSYLGDLVVRRGLYDFATLCSTENNTPDRIDRNEMYIDVALKPVKAAEFIYIPMRIVSTGDEI